MDEGFVTDPQERPEMFGITATCAAIQQPERVLLRTEAAPGRRRAIRGAQHQRRLSPSALPCELACARVRRASRFPGWPPRRRFWELGHTLLVAGATRSERHPQVGDDTGRCVGHTGRMLAGRLLDRARPARSKAAYQELVEQIRADGWRVENYQFPLSADERQAGSTLLQRLALVAVATDCEVWMLYSSFLRALGPGLIWAYGPEAAAIAVGTTGGGPDIPGSPQMPSLNWEELAGDLRLARHFCDRILIHSLEGSVWQGFLPRLRSFEWADVQEPPDGARAAAALRRSLRAALWASAHPGPVLSITSAAAWLAWRWRRG